MLVEVVKEPQPEFKMHPMNAREIDMTGALSSMPSDVLLVEDIPYFIHRKLEELGVKFIKDEFKRFCDNDLLKEEHIHLKTKGLSYFVDIPN